MPDGCFTKQLYITHCFTYWYSMDILMIIYNLSMMMINKIKTVVDPLTSRLAKVKVIMKSNNLRIFVSKL